MTILAPARRTARLIRVRGVVQGVGFRPFVHRLALRHGLGGAVRNGSGEVTLTVEGPADEVEQFLLALRSESPPLARIAAVEVSDAEPAGLVTFTIEESQDEPGRRLPVPPDVGLCPACTAELESTADRRAGYPFVTCTDCGPRYTVIEQLPYDRERTSMRAFTQCPACLTEYHAPGNRRHHSETNSCSACGPELWLENAGGRRLSGSREEAIEASAGLLRRGAILAVRGFGGFHLAVDATSEESVRRLRERKHREAKPLAVMVRTIEDATRLALVPPEAGRILASPARPIVLVRRRAGSPLAPAVAPGLDMVGLMLPSTPLHHLLLRAVGRPLVMTSGNLSEEPIAIGNEEARHRLGGIADAFLLHDREILSRCDDSVVRVSGDRPLVLRRARGWAPLPLALPVASPVPLVAVGAHLKNTFTLVQGAEAWPSPHIGDLESLEGLTHFRQTLEVYRRLFRIEPEAVVHDLHPGYLSTRIAREMGLPSILAVQHHHAHIAAVLAEHGETGPVIGVACDGTGYGEDGTIRGAEVLMCDLLGFRRLGCLRDAPLPGGDLAVRRPWRAALGYASLAGAADRHTEPLLAAALEGIADAERALALRQLGIRGQAPAASSLGRLFDAAAAVLGVRRSAEYEGQAAMELESLAGNLHGTVYPMAIADTPDRLAVLEPLPLLIRLAGLRREGLAVSHLAADFHESVAEGLARLTRRAVGATGLHTVALGGGSFQNLRLLASLTSRLESRGLRVLTARDLPPNDGAVSYGQAAVAAARLALAPPPAA